jgi:hypothetical protein
MVVLANQINKLTGITLYSALTSATVFHLLVKCVLLVFIIWVIFKWEPENKTDQLHITYKQKSIVISIICILVIITVWFLKKYKFYSDDLFFISIVLVIWVYAWRQNNNIAGFLATLPNQTDMLSQDTILPIPGTDILSYQGLKAAPVTPSADKRSGVLPEHYDYLPDNMNSVSSTPAAFDPAAPLNSEDELPQFNRMINLMEPTDHPVYKLTNEVLTALDNKCLAYDSSDTAKPMTEFMRQNGAGQSKWAFIEESEQQSVSAAEIQEQDNKRPPKSLNDKTALMEMFGGDIGSPKNKYDTHEYSYTTDSANKKYPGVDNHCSLLGQCTNVNLPNAHSLNIIATNKIN